MQEFIAPVNSLRLASCRVNGCPLLTIGFTPQICTRIEDRTSILGSIGAEMLGENSSNNLVGFN